MPSTARTPSTQKSQPKRTMKSQGKLQHSFHQASSYTNSNCRRLGSCTYPLSFSQEIAICIRRGFQRLSNNPGPLIGGAIANSILALIIGSVFYRLGETSAEMDRRSMLMFFALMITGFAPAFETLLIYAQRPIVEKQDRYALYHPFAEGIAAIICDLPNKLGSTIGFSVVLYFMANLRPTAGAFFVFLLFNFTVMMTMSMWFRTSGSVSRTVAQSLGPGATVVQVFIITSGFVIPINYLVPWLGWTRWLNPIAYTFQSLVINEVSLFVWLAIVSWR